MANDTSTGYASNWNVPNVNGATLLTFSANEYPFLGRVAGRRIAQSDEFAMSAQYALEAFSSTGVTEADSTAAPTAVAYERTSEVNAIQIFHKSINVTYNKLASSNRLKFAEVGTSGLAYSSDPLQNAIDSELAFQVGRVQEQLYGNLETAMLSGTYQKATSAAVANQMGGIISLTSAGANTVAASSAQLSKELVDELLRGMAAGGAKFSRGVIYANAYQKQKLSNIYSFVPTDRNMGGANIQMIETDFGRFEVVFSRFVPAGTVLLADMAYVNLVNQTVPNKQYMPDGLFLMEQLAKTGASEKWQMYGQLSVDIGSKSLHGTITGLATA
jgi:hypothetical protein